MEYVYLFVQTFMDTFAMFILCHFIAKQRIQLNKKSVYWFFLFQLFCIIARLEFIDGGSTSYLNQVDFINFDLLPVKSIFGMVFLLLAMLILNSMFFKLTNAGVLITTALTFIVWILIRMVSIVAVSLFIEPELFYHTYIYRGLTILLAYIIYAKLSIALLNSYTARRSIFVGITIINCLQLQVLLKQQRT